MPAGDRTGPWGLGPRTGRALGYCSGFGAPGYMFPGPGLGLGRGFGLGRGRGFWWPGMAGFWGYPHYPMAPHGYQPGVEEESSWLADQAKRLEQQLAQIQKRLAELEKEKEAKK